MFDRTKNMGGKTGVKSAINKVIHKLLTVVSQTQPLCLVDIRLMPRRQQTIASQTIDYCLPDKHLRIYKNIRFFLRLGKNLF